MTKEEIEKAIERTWLPLNIWDIFFIAISVIVLLFYAYVCIVGSVDVLGISLAISAMAILWWRYFSLKKITLYPSVISIAKKDEVLGKLVNDATVKSFIQKEKYCRLIFQNSWYSTRYNTIIFYNESAYGINCTRRYWGQKRVATGKTQQIIGKIKRLESAFKI